MNYHNITTDDMKNGDGLRVVLWVAGCDHHCHGCHNPITWDPKGGLPVTAEVLTELWGYLNQPHIAGLTLSGGDPLHPDNLSMTRYIVEQNYISPNKTVWIYTGYKWEDMIQDQEIACILCFTDVVVDGEYVEALNDVNYPWAGSTNQRVIDVHKSLKEGKVVLHEGHKNHQEGWNGGTVQRAENCSCCD